MCPILSYQNIATLTPVYGCVNYLDDLKLSVQCTEAARKAMSALRWSRRSFKYIDSNTFKVLYKTYIRPRWPGSWVFFVFNYFKK